MSNDAPLRLTFAGLDYLDRTRDLFERSVKPEGIELTCVRMGPYELFQQVAQGIEFDVAEMSASNFIALVSRQDRRYVGIPVFLSRRFRHSDIFVHGPGDIAVPGDLVGRRVGVPDYEMTAALWQRAFLEHDFGVAPRQLRWFQGGELRPGFVKRMELSLPEGISVDVIPEDRTLHDMVATGEIDAVLCPHTPAGLTDGSGRVRRLFPDYVAIEREYYRRTRFFPIMHLTLLRRDIYEAHPWVAASLARAFAESQARGWQRMREFGALAVMVPWLMRDVEEIAELMGPDHWPYGFKRNFEILSSMCSYSLEQGLALRPVAPEELFAPETYDLDLTSAGNS
jgi:4,5-dihydroxyphthalate decarboxylase